ncbi:MAG: STAS domain-containing protein [Candidatus Methanofastidiosia archaeon]
MQRKNNKKSEKYYMLELLKENKKEILNIWMKHLTTGKEFHVDLISKKELKEILNEFINAFLQDISSSDLDDIAASDYNLTAEFLSDISSSIVERGLYISDVIYLTLSLKDSIFEILEKTIADDHERFIRECWTTTNIIRKLTRIVIEDYTRNCEKTISTQREMMAAMATPAITLWENILMLPIVGLIDSRRAQMIMEACLEKIATTESGICIIDISGVPSVDTAVANHLIKVTKATKLMGADCIVSGISPQIAQTMINLGIEIGDIITTSSLRDALKLSLNMSGFAVEDKKEIIKKRK